MFGFAWLVHDIRAFFTEFLINIFNSSHFNDSKSFIINYFKYFCKLKDWSKFLLYENR